MKRFPERGVVVCPEPPAARAGGQIFEQGGNAFDAVVAAGFAQGVVNPMMCGLGGTGGLQLHHVASNTTLIVNALVGAGSLARPDSYRYNAPSVYSNRYVVENLENYVGHKAATLPTLVTALWETHTRYGSLPWEQVVQPAIDLAADGFAVYPYMYRFWDPDRTALNDSPSASVVLNGTPESARIYLRHGRPYGIGEVLRQPEYAASLRRIATGGAAEFYRGEMARAMAADFAAHGGFITLEDLANCVATLYEPVYGSYRGYAIAAGHAPSMGPFEIEAMHILEHLDVAALGWQSPRYLDTMARVFQAMYAERVEYSIDPRFGDVPLDLLLSQERAGEWAERISRRQGPAAVEPVPHGSHTTHVSVVDAQGNAAALTQSNGDSCGAVTPGLGFLYNNHMHMFDPRPGRRNSVAPGKRAQSGCTPIMLFRDGELRLVSGSLSRFKVTSEIHALVGMIDFGLNVQAAVEPPRVHAEYAPDTLYVESTVSQSMQDALRGLGWKTQEVQMNTPMCIVALDPQRGAHAAVDPRGGGGVWPAA